MNPSPKFVKITAMALPPYFTNFQGQQSVFEVYDDNVSHLKYHYIFDQLVSRMPNHNQSDGPLTLKLNIFKIVKVSGYYSSAWED